MGDEYRPETWVKSSVADPDPASESGSGSTYLNNSAKSQNLLGSTSFKSKNLTLKYVFPFSSLFAYNNMQMIELFSTENKHKYSLGAKGNQFKLQTKYRKISYTGIMLAA